MLYFSKSFFSKFIVGIVAASLVLAFFAQQFPAFTAQAQTTREQERIQLEEELKKLEEEIKQTENSVVKTQQQKKTLQNQITVLRGKIQKLDLQISQSNKLIKDLRMQIGDTTLSIQRTQGHIDATKEQLREILRLMYEESQKPKLEVLLSGSKLSEFFDNVVALEMVNVRNEELFAQLEDLNQTLQAQKQDLEKEKSEEENFVKIQMLQKQENQSIETSQKKLLTETQGKEAEYQKILADKKKKAQEIRTRIFELVGIPDAPTFGEAVEIAKYVSSRTGVRAELLLAVLTQESNLGKNVGQCYLKNAETGDGVVASNGRSFKAVMKPSRDVQPFLTITKELGRDPFKTPVSCPIPSVGGYGGAMGPAQFIPSTWMGYRPRLEAMLGRPGDPWKIADAFTAAALYLKDAGAGAKTYSAEWKAAMIYFSGSTNLKYRFYGDSVMAIVRQYEQDIKTLEGKD